MPLSCPVAPPKRQMPLSCPVAPPYQRELHKDGGGGGGGVARRARAARAPKAKSCATSSATSSATSCAASLTCWRRRRRWWWWWSNVSSSSHTGGRTCTHPGVDEEGPREPVRRHWKKTMDKINCAASFTCSPFTCRRRDDEETVRAGLAGCARDQPCASWGSRLPTSRLNDWRLG